MIMSICRWLFSLFSAQHPSTGAGIRRPRPLPEFLLKSFPPTTPPESFTAVRDIGVSQFIWSFQSFSTYLSFIPRGVINDVKCHISPISKDHVILGRFTKRPPHFGFRISVFTNHGSNSAGFTMKPVCEKLMLQRSLEQNCGGS